MSELNELAGSWIKPQQIWENTAPIKDWMLNNNPENNTQFINNKIDSLLLSIKNKDFTDTQKNDIKNIILEKSKDIKDLPSFFDEINISINSFWSDQIDYDSLSELIKISYESHKKTIAIQTKAVEDQTKAVEDQTKAVEDQTKAVEDQTKAVEEQTKAIKDQEVDKDKEKHLKFVRDTLLRLKITKNTGYYQNVLDLVNDNNFDWAISALKSPDTLYAIATDLKSEDPKKYENFKSSLILINPDFEPIFQQIEDPFFRSEEALKLWTESTIWIHKNWGVISKTDDETWLNIEVDEDWNRSISLEDSDYKLGSELDNRENNEKIQTEKQKYNQKILEFKKDIDSISNKIKYIKEKLDDINKLNDKENIYKDENIISDICKNLGIERNKVNFNSTQEFTSYLINQFSILSGELKRKQEEKKSYINRIKLLVVEELDKNADQARERDIKKKELLKELKKIGFDLIPKDVTDQLIREIKSKWQILPWLESLNPQNIDLERENIDLEWVWTFWENWIEIWWKKRMVNLIHFMEKLIYGEVWRSDSIYAWKDFLWVLWNMVNPTEMNHVFLENWLKFKGPIWWWDINKMRENLYSNPEKK